MDEELMVSPPVSDAQEEAAEPMQESPGGEVLEKAQAMLLDPRFEPVIEQALTGASNIASAAATLVAPIIFRIGQEIDIPDEELFGTEGHDGIAIKLLADVFDIAAAAGVDGATDRGMAEQAVSKLQDLMAQMDAQGGAQAPQERAPQPRGLMLGGA